MHLDPFVAIVIDVLVRHLESTQIDVSCEVGDSLVRHKQIDTREEVEGIRGIGFCVEFQVIDVDDAS